MYLFIYFLTTTGKPLACAGQSTEHFGIGPLFFSMKVANTIAETFNDKIVHNITDGVFNRVEVTSGCLGRPDKEQDRKQ